MKKIEIKLPKADIEEFCEICSKLKRRGIYIEVGQGTVDVSGSSILGLTMIDENKSADLIIRQNVSARDTELFKKWIVPLYFQKEGYTAYVVRNGRAEKIGTRGNFTEFIAMFLPYLDDDVEFKAGDCFGIRPVTKEEIKDAWKALNSDGTIKPEHHSSSFKEVFHRFHKACEKVKK